MSKFQVALDFVDLDTALRTTEELIDYVDIFEAGTPFILRYGLPGVKKIKETFPEITMLADPKIFDEGGWESELFLREGIHYVTVMERTNDNVIRACTQACNQFGGECMVSMMGTEITPKRIEELEATGAHVLAVHISGDIYMHDASVTPLKPLAELSALAKRSKTAVAGGIKLENIRDYLSYDPDIVIIGGAVMNAKNRLEAAKAFSDAIRSH